VLKKSFLADERNFFGPLMRFARGDVRDHIVSLLPYRLGFHNESLMLVAARATNG
jgi:hypothetical protein